MIAHPFLNSLGAAERAAGATPAITATTTDTVIRHTPTPPTALQMVTSGAAERAAGATRAITATAGILETVIRHTPTLSPALSRILVALVTSGAAVTRAPAAITATATDSVIRH